MRKLYKIVIFLSSLGAAQDALALNASYLQPRIKAAILGSALADALARAVSSREKRGKELRGIVTTVRDFQDDDWIYDKNGTKIAAFTDSTIISHLLLETFIKARKDSMAQEEVCNCIADQLIHLFAMDNDDPLFRIRNHTNLNQAKAGLLAKLSEHKTCSSWWLAGQEDFETTFSRVVEQENNSDVLMRAWPVGLAFADDLLFVKKFVDTQTIMTHRNPTARAASAALAVGIASILQGLKIDDVIAQMITAAEAYDQKELIYKPQAIKMQAYSEAAIELMLHNKLLTSDMIRCAAQAAKAGTFLEKLFGSREKTATASFLLGYRADEAIAASVYLFVRFANDFKRGLVESVHVSGHNTRIASLTMALIGAYNGYREIKKAGYIYDLEMLENANIVLAMANDLYVVLLDYPPYRPEINLDVSMKSVEGICL